MKPGDLKVNQLIEIDIDTDSDDKLYLPSRIEEIAGDNLYISVPMYRGSILPLRVGQKIRISFTYKEVTYAFNSIVVSRKWNRVPLLEIKKPDSLIKIQRRGYMRLQIAVDVRFRVAGEKVDFCEGVTVDVSGGGILLLTPSPIEANQMLEVELHLPGKEPLFCKARVLRLLEKGLKEGKVNKAALEFNDIAEGKRDKIISFIFEKQREWIQKGLLQ